MLEKACCHFFRFDVGWITVVEVKFMHQNVITIFKQIFQNCLCLELVLFFVATCQKSCESHIVFPVFSVEMVDYRHNLQIILGLIIWKTLGLLC